MLAAIAIIVTAIQKWLAGLQLENLGAGTLSSSFASKVFQHPNIVLAGKRLQGSVAPVGRRNDGQVPHPLIALQQDWMMTAGRRTQYHGYSVWVWLDTNTLLLSAAQSTPFMRGHSLSVTSCVLLSAIFMNVTFGCAP